MKRIFIFLITLLIVPSISFADCCNRANLASVITLGTAMGAAPTETCSGDASSGANESFEKGDPNFCTTDWTVTDTDGKVSTSDAAVHWCGTASLSIVADADSPADDYAELDFGAGDDDFYNRFYYKVPDVTDWSTTVFWSADNAATPESNVCLLAKIYDGSTGGTTVKLYIRGDADSTNYFTLTEGAWYRIEIHVVKGGSSGVKVWDSVGNPVNHDGAAAEATTNGSAYQARYIHLFGRGSGTGYFDDYQVSLSGGAYIGAQSCIVGP